MNSIIQNSKQLRLLSFVLLGIVGIFIIANMFGLKNYPLVDDWYPIDILFIIFPAIAVIFGVIISIKYKGKGNHGKAWIFFTLAVLAWYIGELEHSYEDEYSRDDISTLTSDIFYILGYPLFFAFTIFYLKPRRDIISKKMIFLSSVFALALVAPSLHYTFDVTEEVYEDEFFWLYSIYPILDGIILAPSFVAVFLFFRGKVNLLWTLILLGTLIDVGADTLFIGIEADDSYYPGHPIDILYLSTYVLYIFGVYSHLTIYKKSSTVKDSPRFSK